MKDNKTNAPATVNSLDAIKRQLETEMASGADYGKTLQDLATAVAYSVLKKVADPQRKTGKTAPVKTYATAPNGETNGNDSARQIQALRRGVAGDRSKLDSIEYAASRAWETAYNADGDLVQTFDAAAMKDFDKLMQAPLSDGIDLVQTAALAIMEQAAAHGGASGWLDKPYETRKLDKRVVIRSGDSAAWKETETTPMQEIYRAVRALIQRNKAVSIDPANMYTYLETETDGEQTFRRMPRMYDLGAEDCTIGLYSADEQTVAEYDALVARLNLTSRQAQILRLRMQGYGYKAIATALGVSKTTITRTLDRMKQTAAANVSACETLTNVNRPDDQKTVYFMVGKADYPALMCRYSALVEKTERDNASYSWTFENCLAVEKETEKQVYLRFEFFKDCIFDMFRSILPREFAYMPNG